MSSNVDSPRSALSYSLPVSVGQRRSLLVWTLCCVCAGLGLLVYMGSALSSGVGAPILPLDDSYIHLQYARQIALGQPYVYNPGLPPTSGATSFLYPYLLAVGYALGFTDLWLGLWAMILGAVAHAVTAYLIYRCLIRLDVPFVVAAGCTFTYGLCGLPMWHAFSGMETAVIAAALLWTIHAVIARQTRQIVIGAAVCALLRPEAAVIAGAVGLLLVARAWQETRRVAWGWVIYGLPAALVIVQPILNRLITGSAVASGSSAKSVFGMIPFDFGAAFARVLDQFLRLLTENFATPNSVGMAGQSVLLLLALGGWALLLRRRERRGVGVTIGLIILGVTGLIATLDTAFWHFKRYQAPLFGVVVILAGCAIGALLRGRVSLVRRVLTAAAALYGFALLAAALVSAVEFVRDHALNVGYVTAQPYALAQWLAVNAPADAVIAVHDVGMMRYMGGRTTFDMVGLTTPGAAESWRSGPGAIGELLDRTRPELIAAYGEGHGTGLGYLAATDLYAQPLAEYRVDWIDGRGVALAAPVQGVYQPHWEAAEASELPEVIAGRTPWLDDLTLVDAVDVADLTAERDHVYTWTAAAGFSGFATEYFQFPALGCRTACTIMEGGRRISGGEQFTLAAQPGRDALLITRVHAGTAGTVQVFVNDSLIAERVIPSAPGYFVEMPTLIPAALVTTALRLRLVPQAGLIYQPYHHWLYQGEYRPEVMRGGLAAYQGGAIQLVDATTTLVRDGDRQYAEVTMTWASDGAARGDGVLFVHVIDADGGQPAAQADARLGGGGLPPGNWISGAFRETIRVEVTDLPAGQYAIALGLYDPSSGTRFAVQPTGDARADVDQRLFVGTFDLGQ